MLNGRCANQNSQLMTKVQCCCDSGRCWSEGSIPELCPIRGSGWILISCLLVSLAPLHVSDQCGQCFYAIFIHNLICSFSHVTTKEDYQKLCIQIPDGNGGGSIPGRIPGTPDIPSVYPLPYPVQPLPGQDPRRPVPIPPQTGPVPGQPNFPGPGPYPRQPVAPPPRGWSFVFVTL